MHRRDPFKGLGCDHAQRPGKEISMIHVSRDSRNVTLFAGLSSIACFFALGYLALGYLAPGVVEAQQPFPTTLSCPPNLSRWMRETSSCVGFAVRVACAKHTAGIRTGAGRVLLLLSLLLGHAQRNPAVLRSTLFCRVIGHGMLIPIALRAQPRRIDALANQRVHHVLRPSLG